MGPPLTELDLSSNFLETGSSEGMHILADALQGCTTLTALDISDNQVIIFAVVFKSFK